MLPVQREADEEEEEVEEEVEEEEEQEAQEPEEEPKSDGDRARADEEEVQREAHAHRKGRLLDCAASTLALLRRLEEENGTTLGARSCLKCDVSWRNGGFH